MIRSGPSFCGAALLSAAVRRVLLVGVVLSVLAGCSGSDDMRGKPTVPVTVQVVRQGAPVGDCQVVLHPLAKEEEKFRRALPNGRTDAQGLTRLTSYVADDGAAVGEYVVTLACKPVVGEEDGDPVYGPDAFEGRYASVKTSPLRTTIRDGAAAEPLRIEVE